MRITDDWTSTADPWEDWWSNSYSPTATLDPVQMAEDFTPDDLSSYYQPPQEQTFDYGSSPMFDDSGMGWESEEERRRSAFVAADRASLEGLPDYLTNPYAQYDDYLRQYGTPDPNDPRTNPNVARELQYGSAVSGGNPVSVVATDVLKAGHVPFAEPLGMAAGTLADAATYGALSGMAGGNEDITSKGLWGEAAFAAVNSGSLGLGKGLPGLGRNAAGNVTGNLAVNYVPQGLEAYSQTGLPGSDVAGNPYVQTGAAIASAIPAFMVGYKSPEIVKGLGRGAGAGLRSLDEAAVGLDARINESAGFEAGGRTTAGMAAKKGNAGSQGEIYERLSREFEGDGVQPDTIRLAEEWTATNATPAWERMKAGTGTPGDSSTVAASNALHRLIEDATAQGKLAPSAGGVDDAAIRAIRDKQGDAYRAANSITNPIAYEKAIARADKQADAALAALKTQDVPEPRPVTPEERLAEARASDARTRERWAAEEVIANDKLDNYGPVSGAEILALGTRRVGETDFPGRFEAEYDALARARKLDPNAPGPLSETRPATPDAPVARAEPPVVPPRKPPTATGGPGAPPPHNPIEAAQARKEAEGITGRTTLGRTGPLGNVGEMEQLLARQADEARVAAFHGNAITAETRAMDTARGVLKQSTQNRLTGPEMAAARSEQARAGQSAYRDAIQSGSSPAEANAARKAAMGGQIVNESLPGDFSPTVLRTLENRIAKAEEAGIISPFDGIAAHSALDKIQTGAKTVEPNEAEVLRRVFGEVFTDSVLPNQPHIGTGFEATGPTLPGFEAMGEAATPGVGPHLRSQPPIDVVNPRGIAPEVAQQSTPVDLIARRDAALVRFATADDAASVAERQAVGQSKGEFLANQARGKGKVLSDTWKARQEDLWAKKLATAKDQGAATTAGRLRADANRELAQVNDLARQFRPEGVGDIPTAGPAMRTTGDITPSGDLVLRGQTAADVELGVTPHAGESRSVAAARRGTELKTTRQKAISALVDVINLPRAFKAGFDASATLRQSLPLGLSNPSRWRQSFGAQVRSMRSQEAFDQAMNAIRTAPLAGLREKAGLFLAHAGATDKLSVREEMFATRLAGKIPGLRNSERGYVAMLDTLRANVFDDTVERWLKQGVTPSEQDLKSLAATINHATGRGTGTLFDQAGTALSLGFFAPRYWVSKPQMFFDLATATPLVRREAAKTVAVWLGGMATMTALVELAGGKTGVNPLGGDFGQVGWGDTTYDVTGGLATDVRLASRLITGKKQTGGGMASIDRPDVLGRYVRGKLSPSAALSFDLLSGKDYNGNATRLDSLSRVQLNATNLFGNLFMSDVLDAFKNEAEGMRGLSPAAFAKFVATALLAGLGANPRVDNSDTTQLDNKIKKELGIGYFEAIELSKNDPAFRQKFLDWTSQPEIAAQIQANIETSAKRGSPGAIAMLKAQALTEEYRGYQEVDDAELGTTLTPDQWRDKRNDRQIALRAKKEIIYEGSTSEEKTKLDRYYAQFDKPIADGGARKPNGEIDFDRLDAWLAKQDEATRQLVAIKTGGGTETEQRYFAARSALDTTGYFDLYDAAWTKLQASNPSLAGFATEEEWRSAALSHVMPALQQKYPGASDVQLQARANEEIAKMTVSKKLVEVKNKKVEYDWAIANPEEFMQAIEWGYLEPDTQEKKWQQAMWATYGKKQ